MIYNFAALLRAQFPAETFFVNGLVEVAGQAPPDRCHQLNEGSGSEAAWMLSGFQMVQVLSRDVTAPAARAMSWAVLTYLTRRFGLILPAVTVGGVLYPEIQSGQISAVARPQSIGEDEEGRHEFSVNYQIYWRR